MDVIEVAIGPINGADMFKVDVLRSRAGEASANVALDVEMLQARRAQLQHAILASAVPSRAVLSETERPLREVGAILFSALLGSGEVAGRYRASAALATDKAQGLRVVLRIDSALLAGLPWEAMYDDAVGAYVCRHEQVVRQVPVASVAAPLMVQPPLRILGVISSPRGLPVLDVEKEKEQLVRALGGLCNEGLVDLQWAPKATWAELQELLLSEEWHVVHFIGHGDFDPDRDEGVLVLVDENGRRDLVEADRIVDLLRQARPMPRLVVLNACSGAVIGTQHLFSGTAAALVRGGVSAVAAMQYEISDPAAAAFARGFYTAIAHGRGVDDATSSGRVAILGTSARTLEWVTPVLYLRGNDSHLFTLPPAGRSSGSIHRTPTGTESTRTNTSETDDSSQHRARPPVGETANHNLPVDAHRRRRTTNRWRHTTNGSEVPTLTHLGDVAMSQPGYMNRLGGETTKPWVRVGVLVACGLLGPTPPTSELSTRFLDFLGRQPVSGLISALTSAAEGVSWALQAGNGRIALEAIMSDGGQEDAPVASALMRLPQSGLRSYGRDQRFAELVVDVEPRTKDDEAVGPANLTVWFERLTWALAIPSALTKFLSKDVGLVSFDDPPAQFGIWLRTQHSITELVDTEALKSLPGQPPPNCFIAYAIANPEGKSATGIALDFLTQLCDHTLHLDGYEPVLRALGPPSREKEEKRTGHSSVEQSSPRAQQKNVSMHDAVSPLVQALIAPILDVKSSSASSWVQSSVRRTGPVSLIVIWSISLLFSGGVLAVGLTQIAQGKDSNGFGGAIAALIFVICWLLGSIFLLNRTIRKYRHRRG